MIHGVACHAFLQATAHGLGRRLDHGTSKERLMMLQSSDRPHQRLRVICLGEMIKAFATLFLRG
jgi:hypothetical protein